MPVMAKDKTKPRPELAAKREAERQEQAALTAKRRRGTALKVLITLVIVGLIGTGIGVVITHVQSERRKLEVTGKAGVQQITPPNATSDGLAIVANPDAELQDGAITVDIHIDYQCSGCVVAGQYYGPALTTLAEQGYITLRYHLRTSQDASLSNTASERAAIAAACADTVGQFPAYNQAVLNASSTTSPADGAVVFTDEQLQQTFPAAAGITGDDLTNFRQCYTDRATSTFIAVMDSKNKTTAVPDNAAYASGVAISSTPAVFANNKTVDLMSDLYNATAAQADPQALLELLATAAYSS